MLNIEKNTTSLKIQANSGDVLRILVENRGRLDHDHGGSNYTTLDKKVNQNLNKYNKKFFRDFETMSLWMVPFYKIGINVE